MGLVQHFSAYSGWRAEVSRSITTLREWLSRNELGDAQSDTGLEYLLERLRGDKLTIAFVAEFSRGKSELINAIFFADYGSRILPSSTGRTTMCPTELQYDPALPLAINLLPIETREKPASVAEFKHYPDEWRSFPLDTASGEAMQEELKRVGEQKRVSTETASKLGFVIDPQGETGLKPDSDGMVDIPCWRHAVINFRHPLLEQGLVILDTPGLNAIGAEPELTLSLLPNAHAILFILSIDTGVTQSDLIVWRNHVCQRSPAGNGRYKGRLAVLNKIDSLWDGLRAEAEIESEISRQVQSCAQMLELEPDSLFPVSAQKALLAKINHDAPLLVRSRISRLESALTRDLIPAKQEIVASSVRLEAMNIIERASGVLQARLSSLHGELDELNGLHGKNRKVVQYLLLKVRAERDEFDHELKRYYATRGVLSALGNKLFSHLGLDALREETRRTRETMLKSAFSKGLMDAMASYFDDIRQNLKNSARAADEINEMMQAMYKKFRIEHGLKLGAPAEFIVERYEKEIDRLQQGFDDHFHTLLRVLTTGQRTLTQRFFETIAGQVRRTLDAANRDASLWLQAVMAPVESQVRENRRQLRHRLENINRIYRASDTLEDRLAELKQTAAGLNKQARELSDLRVGLEAVLSPGDVLAAAARAA